MELRSDRNPRAYTRGLVLGASLAALLAASPALAGGVLPTGGQVTAGQATIGASSNGLAIDQASGHAIINWQNFSIGAGNAVKFNNGSGATLNRVTGGNLSQIDGVLKATGSVYLINPQGVVVGPGGKVITGGSFVASTRDVDNDAFMKGGPLHASGTSNGAVVNQGKIVSRYGDTILIGKSVSNSGIIKASRGTAGLAAGDDVTLRPMDGDARISISAGKGDVTNTGTIAAAQAELNAAGGNVYAVAGNQGGITVTGTKDVGGRIWLTGGDTAQISGTVSATNKDGSGGTIVATAPTVTVNADARISASGNTGGTVLLGGDEAGGSDPARRHVAAPVATARTTTVAQGAQISADGSTGAGGAVVVWSDDYTSYNGLISARGATAGGFAEVSSHGVLDYQGLAVLTADNGHDGTLLLDPSNLTISTGTTSGVTGAPSYTNTGAGNTASVLNISTLVTQLSSANVSVTSTGSITIKGTLAWSTANNLSLTAGTSIALGTGAGANNATITAANAVLTLKAGSTISGVGTPSINTAGLSIAGATSVNISMTGFAGTLSAANINSLNFTSNTPYSIGTNGAIAGITATGAVSLTNGSASNANITVNSAITSGSLYFIASNNGPGTVFGNAAISTGAFTLVGINWLQNSATLPAFSATAGLAGDTVNHFTRVAGGDGTAATPFLIADVYGLQGMSAIFGSSFALANDIDASGTSAWNGGAGFTPLSNFGHDYVQTFDGQNHTITGLTIFDNTGLETGLFRDNYGTIKNLALSGGSVTGVLSVGSLVGVNYGTISNASSSSSATSTTDNIDFNQTGYGRVGGLVGWNMAGGTITGASATGAVISPLIYGMSAGGGLVGENDGLIDTSSGGGTVSLDTLTPGGYAYAFGGLVGWNNVGGVVTNSHATGAITGGAAAGGLVGYNLGSISGSWASGTVTAVGNSNFYFGGLVGWNGNGYSGQSGSIANSYATGSVTGMSSVGGLVGQNDYGTITNSHATGDVTGRDGNNASSGLGGLIGTNSLHGTITGSYSTGSVMGTHNANEQFDGGFAGTNHGTISASYATGSVDGTGYVGGFTGSNDGTISTSYATGNANSGANGYYGGGFAGENDGTLNNVYATGSVTGAGAFNGGLAGVNNGAINSAYFTGTVGGTGSYFGGVAGINNGSLTHVYWNSEAISTGDGYNNNTPSGATGLTLAQFKDGTSITGFDSNIWSPADGTYAPGLYGVSYVVKVSAAGGTVQYGDQISNALTFNSLQNGDLVSSITGLTVSGATQGDGVGTYALTASGASLTSSSGTAYRFIYQGGNINITQRQLILSLTGTTVKTYDGNTDVSLTAANFGTLGNIYNGEDVSLIGLPTTASYSDKNAGSGKTVTVTGFQLTGANATNYILASTSGNIGTINKAVLTDSLTGTVSKTYDATTAASLGAGNYGTLSGIIGHDDVAVDIASGSATYDNANAVGNKTVTVSGLQLTGVDAGNYTIGSLSGVIGNIDKATVTVGLTGTVSKTYDGSNSATLSSGNYSVSGLMTGLDDAALVILNGNYDNKNVGTTKTVSVTGLSLTGTAASNYTLASDTASANIGRITAKTITVGSTLIGSVTKVYDSTTAAILAQSNYSLSGIITNDDVTVNGTAIYASANAASGLKVTASGLTLSGTDMGNYVLSRTSITGTNTIGTITAATLTFTANAASRLYGAADPAFSGTITGFVGGQTQSSVLNGTLTFGSVATSSSNVGSYAINGSGLTLKTGSNYVFAQAAGNATALTINPATLTYTATAANRTYGTTNPAFSGTITGFVLGQTQATATTGTLGFSSAVLATDNVGSYAVTGAGLAANNGNYVFVQASGNATALTINPATLTYTAAAASKTYGDANPALGGTVTGFVLGQTQASQTGGTLTFATLADGTSGVGHYAVTGSGLSSNTSNYVFAQAVGNATALTINPATLTITASNATKIYGNTLSFAGTEFGVSGLLNSDAVSSVSLTSGGAAATANVAGSSYAITASNAAGTGLGNYTIGYVAGALTISPATLTITANNASKTYGNALAFAGTEFSTSGLVNSDGVASVFLTSTGAAATATVNGGSPYAITASNAAGVGLSNYTIGYVAGGLTINPAPLTITANSASKTYGVTLTFAGTEFSASGLVNSDSVTGVSLSSSGAAATAIVNGGSPYAITASNAVGTGLSNYTIGYVDGGLIINPASLTVTANSNQSKVYGDNDPTFGYTISTGNLVNGDTLIGALSRDTGEDVGNYAITQGSLVASANYTLNYTAGVNFNITPMALTVAANSGQNKVYGDTDPVFGYQLTAGHLVGTDALTGALSRDTGEDVGGYAINQGSLAASTNYAVTYAGANFNIAPMALTVAANSGQTKVYGDTDPVFGYSFTTGHLVGTDALTGALSRDTGEDVGGYAINQGSLAASANYTLNYTTGTNFNITPMALTVSADSKSKIYGASDPVGSYAVSGGHLVGSDTLTGALSRDAGETIGAYAITRGTLDGGNNYTLAFIPGTLSITPAALTITAGSGNKVYGDTASLTNFTASGLVRGDQVSTVTLASNGAIATANTGSYAIAASGTAGSGLGNYVISYNPGVLTVTPRALTVTIANASAVYGAAAPGFTASASGLVNGDTLSGAPVAAGTHVGTYAITPGTLAASANYVASFQGGTFTITPAALTVTANNIAAQDVSLAQPTASYAGLVNGDSSAVASGLQFGLFPVTGTRYDVVPFGASAADYTIVYVAGVLTVSASQPSQPALPSQIALAIPPQTGSASGSLTIGGQTFVFANAATSAIPGSSDGGMPGITLFQVGLPGHLSGFTNLVVSDYSNATGDSDRLATE